MMAWIGLLGCLAVVVELAYLGIVWRDWKRLERQAIEAEWTPFRPASDEEIEAWERWFKESGGKW